MATTTLQLEETSNTKPVLRLSLKSNSLSLPLSEDSLGGTIHIPPPLLVLGEVNDTKVLDCWQDLSQLYQENELKINEIQQRILQEMRNRGNDSPLLDGSFVRSLYRDLEVPHELQHDAFSGPFIAKWREAMLQAIEQAKSNPDEDFVFNLLFLHSAKGVSSLGQPFTLGRALERLANCSGKNVRTALLNFCPAAMVHDFGIFKPLQQGIFNANNTLLLSLTNAMLLSLKGEDDSRSAVPSNIKFRMVVTHSVADSSKEVEVLLSNINETLQKLSSSSCDKAVATFFARKSNEIVQDSGSIILTYHSFYHLFLGPSHFAEYGRRVFQPTEQGIIVLVN